MVNPLSTSGNIQFYLGPVNNPQIEPTVLQTGYISTSKIIESRYHDSSDVTYFRGSELRQAREIITRQLSQSMVEITDLNEATVHRKDLSLIYSRQPSIPKVDLGDS